MTARGVVSFFSLLFVALLCPGQDAERQRGEPQGRHSNTASSSTHLPREIHGYRVERVRVRIKRPASTVSGAIESSDALVRFGTLRVESITPRGVWLEVPVSLAAVEQNGQIEMLVFEDVRIDGTPVIIEDYSHPFRLPNDEPLELPRPARVYVSVTSALLGATSAAHETWPVTGRVYVCGRFRRFFLIFKRAVPIELSLSVTNPLYSHR